MSNDSLKAIAASILRSISRTPDQVLLYAEVEEGVASADLLFRDCASDQVRFRFAPDSLREKVVDYWSTGDASTRARSWRTLSLWIENGELSVDFKTPQQIDINEDLSERRPRVIEKYFPGMDIDYSRPTDLQEL